MYISKISIDNTDQQNRKNSIYPEYFFKILIVWPKYSIEI